jgi:hypothetical protein
MSKNSAPLTQVVFLGGGVAAVSRSSGLICDALVETDIVLADGQLLTRGTGRVHSVCARSGFYHPMVPKWALRW